MICIKGQLIRFDAAVGTRLLPFGFVLVICHFYDVSLVCTIPAGQKQNNRHSEQTSNNAYHLQ